jgi:hypothetical protein
LIFAEITYTHNSNNSTTEMGWFDSIIDGIGSAVNWAVSNSGAISGIVNAVSTVAGLLAAASIDNANGADIDESDDLFVAFNRANQYLVHTASSMLVPPKLPNTRTVQLSGLWTGASPLDSAGNPSPEMYKDIAKFLVQNDIPLELSGPGDVALRIGQAIFADNAVPPPSPSSSPALPRGADGPPSYIYTPNVNLANDDNTCAITGIHAYYAVPLGKTGTDNAWHGALQLSLGTTSDFDQQYQAYKKDLRLIKSPEGSAYDVWVVTLQIAWTWVPLAIKAYPYIKQAISTTFSDYVLIYYTSDGQLQTIKLQAPQSITPAQVRAVVTQAVTTALAELQAPSSVFTSTKVDGQGQKEKSGYLGSASPPPQMPDITVTSTTLLPAAGTS